MGEARTVIAGIDFSSRFVDVVKLDESTNAATWHRFALTGADAFDRARSVGLAVPGRAMSFWDDVLAVGIEQPQARGPRAARMGDLYRIQGAVLGCIPSARLVQPWWPSAWRKAVGLPGNASKDAVSEWAGPLLRQGAELGPYIGLPFDATDAYCIALATRNTLQREEAA